MKTGANKNANNVMNTVGSIKYGMEINIAKTKFITIDLESPVRIRQLAVY